MARNSRAKPQKLIKLTEKQVEQIKQEATNKAIQLSSVLHMAVMVQNHNLTGEQVCEDMQDYFRWAEFINLHILEMEDVISYVEEGSNLELEYAREFVRRIKNGSKG